jgi:hypothetical protein
MTSTKIEFSFNKINRMSDLADLAEMLFPSNRNQQYAFALIWLLLKWADHNLVPNLSGMSEKHSVSRRTLERVRAKMRRMGLIDHVSRFNAKHGYKEGWVFASRFEHGLRQMAAKVAGFKDTAIGSRDKDMMILELLDGARCAVKSQRASRGTHQVHEVMQDET